MTSSRSDNAPADPFAGWDIGVAAIALACMTTGFWRLWPDALALNDAPLGPVILKAGIAALGFVAIASRWEQTISALARNPFGLLMIALACVSSLWAIVPSEALRNGIVLLVVWNFGIALTLRFRSAELAEICGFAGIVAIVMQVTAHRGLPPVDHFDGDLAFALIASAWAAFRVPARRSVWIIAAGLCFALAFASTEKASLGAVLGFVFGIAVAACATALAKRGTVSVIVAAWAIVACVALLTVFLLFGAVPVLDGMVRYFVDLEGAMIIGQGFGAVGQSVADNIGSGLGLVGLGLSAFVVLATFFQTLFGGFVSGRAVMGQSGAFFACVGAILAAPTQVAMTGPILVLFAATSFAISLACVPKPRKRAPLLFNQAKANPARAIQARTSSQAGARKQAANMPAKALQSPPVDFGLRPKI
jgi:hypothetical protein